MTDEAPAILPGVKPERLNAYLTAKEVAPERHTLPSDLLALAAFLAAIDEDPEPTEEEETEVIGGEEFDDDPADDEACVFLSEDEDEEDAGFEPVTGRDAWPAVVAWLGTAGVRLTPWQRGMAEHFFKW